MVRCSHCHGTGEWKIPIFADCRLEDEGAMTINDKTFKIVGWRLLDCPSCDGRGWKSYQPPPNIFIGASVR